MSDKHEKSLAVTLHGTREIDWNTNISIYFTQEAQEVLVAADRVADTAVLEVLGMVPL
jgi:choline dehydrogenase-like flavoprotein